MEAGTADRSTLPEWMTDVQVASIQQLKAQGAKWPQVKDKLVQFFDQLPGALKQTWEAKYKERFVIVYKENKILTTKTEAITKIQVRCKSL